MAVVTHLLPEGADLAGARALINEHADVTAGRVRVGTSTFYETFDGRLHAEGMTLRHAAGRFTLVDRATGETLAAAAAARAEPRLFDHDLAEALQAHLADVIEMRALVPVARVRTREITLGVLNSDQKTVVRLKVETHEGLRGRVSAQAVRGYEKDLERVNALLTDTMSLPEAAVPLVDEAIAAAGKPAAGTSAKLNLELDPDEPANQAAAKVFARLLEVIDDNFPGTLEDVDSEFLHDLRVAVRRTRSLQRQFKAIYPDAELAHFREELKRIQGVTGDLRDLDVYLLDFPALKASLPEQMQADLDPLKGLLETRRAKALTATRRALRAQRTKTALTEWRTFTQNAPKADRTVKALASHRIRAVYRQMVKMGKAIDDDSPAEDMHELRKVGKELRYLLEFFASLYPPEVGKPFVKSLKGLQDQLGRFQDHEVQAAELRTLAPDVKDPMTLMAMGVLVDRFIKDEALARTEFAERFEAFASPEQRALVKEHFG